MDQFYVILPEICIFIPLSELLLQVSLVCKEWKILLASEQYVRYWIRTKYNLGRDFPEIELIKLYLNSKNNSVLNFSAFKTDAGCSSEEYSNSFKNLFNYSPTPYSTKYSFTMKPLAKNLNCLAVFEGNYKDKNSFFDSFNNDLFVMKYGKVPQKFKIENFDQRKCLTIDPLNIRNFSSYEDFIFKESMEKSIEFPSKFITYSINPSQAKAIVTKIAIARPLNYTGPIKTLLIIANQVFKDEIFENFVSFDNIINLEAARFIGDVRKVTYNDDFEIVEYQRSSGFYPLLWVNFKHAGFNHIEYELSQAHWVSIINAKLLAIDDRRQDWGLPMFEPNFDITYILMLGHEIP